MNVEKSGWLSKTENPFFITYLGGAKNDTATGEEVVHSWGLFYNHFVQKPKFIDETKYDIVKKDQGGFKRTLKSVNENRGFILGRVRNEHRSNDDLIEKYDVTMDIDGCQKTPEEFCALMGKFPRACLWYTTLSNGIGGYYSYRVHIPTQDPCRNKNDYLSMWSWLKDEFATLGLTADKQAKAFSQFFYCPSYAVEGTYAHGVVHGPLLSRNDVPEDDEIPPTEPGGAGARQLTGEAWKPSVKWPHPPRRVLTREWLLRKAADYSIKSKGSRAEWIGGRGKSYGGYFAAGDFIEELTEDMIHGIMFEAFKANSGRDPKKDLEFWKGGWELGKLEPHVNSKAKTKYKIKNDTPHVKSLAVDIVLARTESNKIARCTENHFLLAAASPLGKKLFYNDLFGVIQVTEDDGTVREFNEREDRVEVNRWIAVTGSASGWRDIPRDEWYAVALAVSKTRRRNPFKDHLESLVWDGVKRLETFLIDYAGAPDDLVSRHAARNIFLPLVARGTANAPVKVDTHVVLEGVQGCGKSRLVEAIGGEYYVAYSGKLENDKSTYIVLSRCLVGEMCELAGHTKTELEQQKAFLSMSENIHEVKFLNDPARRLRRFIFIGTTNRHIYLNDTTGNRRTIPVRVGAIDVAGFQSVRDQILAEAWHMWKAGEHFAFPSEETKQMLAATVEEREEEIPDFDGIRAWLSGRGTSEEFITTETILDRALGYQRIDWTKARRNQVADIMRELGYKSLKPRNSLGVQIRCWRKA